MDRIAPRLPSPAVRHAWVLFLIAAVAARADAQTFTGAVRDSVGGKPLGGVVVQIVNARDSVLTAMTTSADGVFRLANVAPLDSARRVRLRRLGFRPSIVSVAAVAGGNATLTMTPLPVALGAMVIVPLSCRDNATSSRARELWNDALASWTAGAASPRGDIPITLVREAVHNGYRWPATPPIRSVSAAGSFEASRAAFESFLMSRSRRRGGVTVDSASFAYAGVLRDPEFAARHCMRLERGRDEHRGELGVVFSPSKGSDQAIELTGALWLDSSATMPRALTFEYVAPAVGGRRRGAGTVVFGIDRDGLPAISRWVLSLLPSHEPTAWRNVRVILPSVSLTALRDTAGDTLLIHWDSATTILGTLPHLTGRVTLLGTDTPLPGVRLIAWPWARQTATFENARTRTSVTDSLGNFDLELPGNNFLLRAGDTTLSAVRRPDVGPPPEYDWDIKTIREGEWGGPPHGAFVAPAVPLDHDQRATIAVPTAIDVFRDACGIKRSRTDQWILAGRIVPDPRAGDDPAQRIIRARWLEPADGRRSPRETVRELAADSLGYFMFCKIPAGQAVRVEVVGLAVDTLVEPDVKRLVTPLVLQTLHAGADAPRSSRGALWGGSRWLRHLVQYRVHGAETIGANRD